MTSLTLGASPALPRNACFGALFRVLRILAILVRALPWDPLLAATFRLVATGGVGPAGVCLSESGAGSCTLATVKLPL